jgi:hypothetical protein
VQPRRLHTKASQSEIYGVVSRCLWVASCPSCGLFVQESEEKEKAFGKEEKWMHADRTRRLQLHVSEDYKPWTRLLKKQLTGVSSSLRVQSMIDMLWLDACAKEAETLGMDLRILAGPSGKRHHRKLAERLIVDVSQSMTRKKASYKLGCLTTSSSVYIYSLDRCLTGADNMLLQGFPREWVKRAWQAGTVSNRGLASLAGYVLLVQVYAIQYK